MYCTHCGNYAVEYIQYDTYTQYTCIECGQSWTKMKTDSRKVDEKIENG